MNARAQALRATVDEQLGELAAVLAGLDTTRARRPCPGRAKLGDGSVGAVVAHTVANYERIAAFLADPGAQAPAGPSGPPTPGGHAPGGSPGAPTPGTPAPGGSPGAHGRPPHGGAPDFDRDALVARVVAVRDRYRRLASLTDGELEAIPPAGSVRFADGRRTLEQVLTGLLGHQAHQIEALRAATG